MSIIESNKTVMLAFGMLLISGISLAPLLAPVHAQESAKCTAQHWEKIDFVVESADVAGKLGVVNNTALNVKVQTDPAAVVDMRQEIISHFNVNLTEAEKDAIELLGTAYGVICS